MLSICIPNYERKEKLNTLIKRIVNDIELNNLYEEVEICVRDDGSLEDPTEYVEAIQCHNPRIRLKYQRDTVNRGMDYNFLNSVKMAEGEYCWIIGNDDLPSEKGILNALSLIRKYNLVDCIVTPVYTCRNGEFYEWLYPLKERTERIYNTSNSREFDELIDNVEDNGTALFCFLSNVIFKRERWVNHGEMFADKMDSIFIQMYMNIQTLVEGGLYLYSPTQIIINEVSGIGNERLSIKIPQGLHGVICHFFSGEQKQLLLSRIMDLYVCGGYLETLSEENRKEILTLQSERINTYREYYIAPEERDVLLKDKRIVIYGSGVYGERALKRISEYKDQIIGFCDSDDKKIGMRIDGYTVYQIEDLKGEDLDRIIFIIESKYNFNDIRDMLISINVKSIGIIE